MHRRSFLQAAGAFLTLTACQEENPSPAGVTRLQVSSFPRIAMSGLYLAEELGYFSEAGLDVEILQITSSPHVIPLLAGGELDVAFVALSPSLINAVTKGANLRLVAGREIASSTCGAVGTVYGNREVFPKGIGDLSLLKGKRVSISYMASVTEFYLDTLLASVGLSSDEVQLVVLRAPEAAAALVGGKVDAIISSHFEKDLEALSASVVRGVGLADLLPNYQYSFIVFGPTLLEDKREAGVRFLAAYLRGATDFLNGKTPRYLDELARASRMDPERARNACRNTFAPDGSIDLPSVQRFVEWAVGKRYCASQTAAAQLVDESFIKEAQLRFQQDRLSFNLGGSHQMPGEKTR